MAEDVSSLKALCFGVFFCFSLAHLSSASCEQNALGLGDIQFNASSQLNANTPAKNGRLDFTAGSSWCAATRDSNPYLQIDLQTVHIICAVSTQGNSKEDQWVESYTLESSTDGTSWTGYKEGGQENKKNFNGNYNRDGTVKHILYSGIVARYLRFVVGARHGEACLRVEIFGVPVRTVCANNSVGISNSDIILDQRFSASRSVRGNRPSHGRLNGVSAWKTLRKDNVNDYLQIDLGSVYFICGVATQGNPKANDWTKTYKLETSLDNVNWVVYVENDTEKIFIGNSDQNTVVRNDLYQPPAAKFIRFYPVLFNNSKALRVEVYGSLQGCLSPMGNERFVNRDVGAKASSELNSRQLAIYSRLYGLSSWCSASASLPQYLDFNFGKVITVSGVATQGDNKMDKWVESYSVSYGYDGKTWLKYSAGMPLTGNIDRHSIVVNWFSSPFAAQYIRITSKTYKDGICMRVDLLGCENFQVPFIFVNKLADVDLTASPGANVTLTCLAKFSQERAPTYVWSKDGALLPESSFSLTITYASATSIHNDYYCARKSPSRREVQCSASFQCSASLLGLPEIKDDTKANVTVILKVPGMPIRVNLDNIRARSTVVTWSYPPLGSDEAPITSYTLRYQNSSFSDNIDISDGTLRKRLINLKPYTAYTVRVAAKSLLGTGDWSSPERFTTSAAAPEVRPQFTNATALTSKTIYVEWQKPDLDKVNGPLTRYYVKYKELVTGSYDRVFIPVPSTSYIIQNLKIWTTYEIKIAISNRFYLGPWSSVRSIKTKQDAPSAPQNLQFNLQGPTIKRRPQMTMTWTTPANQNGVIKEYTLDISYTFKGKLSSLKRNLDSDIFSYRFDVLGGIQYTIKLWAVTVKPGTAKTKVAEVPVYKPSIAPRNITSQKINETTYSIMWDPLPREMSNGKVLAYEVKRTRVSSSRHARAVSIPAVQFLHNTTDTFTILHDLTSCSEYSVSVRAYTSAGPGVFGGLPSRIVTTAPGPPSHVRTDKPEKRSITLLWNKPKLHGDDVKHYTVTYEGSKDYYPEFRHVDSVKTSSLSLTAVNLFPGTKYNFVVIATTHCGDGDNSTMATSTTLKDAPLAPVVRKIENISTTEPSVNVTVWYALQTNGPISHYQLLVHLVKEWSDTISDWNELGQDFYYICAQVPAVSEDPSMVFVIGDGKNYSGYINKALSSGQRYKIYSRGLTVNSKRRSAEEEFLIGKAALIANVEVEEVPEESSSNEQKGDSTVAIAASAVVVLLLVGVAFIVGVIFWRRRRRADEPRLKTNEMYPLRAVNRAYNRTLSVEKASQESPPTGEERVQRVENTSEPIYGNAELEKVEDAPKPVPVNQFSEYVTLLKRDNKAGFEKQYALLMPGQQFACDVAKKPENKSKNRYANIIAYDHSRVKLPLIEGIKNSDYINACFLHGYDSTPNTYIACQGPMPGTYQDFWRMIWQENASTIVMLTQLVENGRTKCNQYWPEKSETYHDITVTNQRTEKFADYAVRTFILGQKGSGERRQVQHFNFLVWPDKGVPRHATAVLDLRRKVRANHKDSKTPLVVHCSAGIGRTGAFIVIDAMLESVQNRQVVDVFNYIQLLRTNRMSMVQTDEQYGFIYMALVEAITCGNTEIPAQDLRIAVRKLAEINPKTKMSGLASEYQRLDLITADDVANREDDVGRKPQNASKNRFPDIVPLNGPRVVLSGDEKNDYINASFVDTYRERNSFIMTQAPLENTMKDFWRMIWDHSIGTIVMLNELKEKGQVYPMYWASEGSTTFGEFVIETASHKIFQDFSEREFTVATKKDPKAIRHVHHYQVTGWPDEGVPRNAQYILDMINKVEGSQRKSSRKAPVVVQCSDGVGRSGTFCAILSIIERLKSEQVIDVCQSVKVIRVNRPGAVDCKTQYVFCYKVVEKYLDSFNDYSNFQ